jgi:nucleotide-binding universal stress UspA family protein
MFIAVLPEPLVLLPAPKEVSWSALRKQAWANLTATRDALAPEARIVVETGTLISRALESVVSREHRDLMVIGSGHHGKDGHVRLGEAAKVLLCDLEVPVAIAPLGMRDRGRVELERIGVGFDGERESEAALRLAAAIARAAGAGLDVLAVVDRRLPGRLSHNKRDALFERATAATETSGVPTRTQVATDKPSDALGSLAARVDLLVIGSSSSGPAGRTSLGRTGNAATSGSPCPMMIVPRPRDDSAL